MNDTQGRPGYLLLEDGRRFEGRYLGPAGGAPGEAVFTTVMTGYQETLTDPSFAGQIVVMTAPMMGVYGVRPDDDQSRRPWVAGFVVRHLSSVVGDGPASGTLESYLREHEIPTLVGADTRAITRHIRAAGAMRGIMAPREMSRDEAMDRLGAEPEMLGRDLASTVSTAEPYELPAPCAASWRRGMCPVMRPWIDSGPSRRCSVATWPLRSVRPSRTSCQPRMMIEGSSCVWTTA